MSEFLFLVLAISLLFNAFIARKSYRRAEKLYQSWRDADIEKIRAELAVAAQQEAATSLEYWKLKSESSIRQDAINRSQAVIRGKVIEHLAPYMPMFPFNPKDARFIGSPIDFLVFDGADEGAVRDVVFLEVKTGNSALNARQKQIKEAITQGRIKWREMRVD